MQAPSKRTTAWLDGAVIALTVVVLALLVIEETWTLSPRVLALFAIADTTICGLFLLEFLYRWSYAADRGAYLRGHWIDLVASVPLQTGLGYHLRWGRLVRLGRALRILRFARLVALLGRVGGRLWSRYKAQPVQFTLMLTLSSVLSGAVLMVYAERGVAQPAVHGAITNFGDALWWSVVTVSTVGYGDLAPASALGRCVAIFLIVIGIATFSSGSAILAPRLIEHDDDRAEATRHDELLARLEDLRRTLDELQGRRPQSHTREATS